MLNRQSSALLWPFRGSQDTKKLRQEMRRRLRMLQQEVLTSQSRAVSHRSPVNSVMIICPRMKLRRKSFQRWFILHNILTDFSLACKNCRRCGVGESKSDNLSKTINLKTNKEESMAKGNGRVFTVVTGSKQDFKCPLLDTTGPVPMNHLVADIYSEGNDDCRKCGVCEAFLLRINLKVKAPMQNVVPISASREMVRPHGWDATQKRNVQRAFSGLGK